MDSNINNVTVILTIWKRDHLEEQMKALLGQTIKPSEICIYHCLDYISITKEFFQKYPMVKYQKNSHDFGYFGRFSLGLHATNKYLYILDDDVIPSPRWLETCLNLCEQHNAIISSSGRVILKKDYYPERIDSKRKVKEW